ncbi:DUF4476 domain-containing protein [Hymenobacter psoromatis]|uniref:DUF4476 domain-containing protein n=1 Tax=Hymenobacter psoromatis TaxID=1484116 RepID=UPI001CC186F9|nr:DUF4476 domain-containing protein [Hymenobacter psoromatis]
MKTLLKLAATFLLLGVTAAPALAAPPANLRITAEQGQPFSLVLDGQLITRPVARQIRVGLLAPGQHWAELSVPTPYGPPIRLRTTIWLQPGLETDYVLLLRPYGPQLRQVALVPLGQSGYGAPGGYYGQGQQPAPGQGGYNYPAPGYDPSAGQGQPGSYPGPSSQSGPYSAPTPPLNYPPNGYPNNEPAPRSQAPAYPGGGNGAAPGGYSDDTAGANGEYPGATANDLQPLAPADVANLGQDLRQRTTDEERLRTATEALAQSSLRADDLTTLLRTLTYDATRIELARFGYAHVSDPQNFSRVYAAFQYRANVRALQQALGLPQN